LPLDELADPLPIEPLTRPFDVTIRPPGSKSLTCRAYVLAALADGVSRIVRPLRADDTDRLLEALCTLGAEASWEDDDVVIQGVAGRFPRGGAVNLGDGGAPSRFMIAAACLAAEPVVVDGSPRMRQRPVAEGVELLREIGADIEYVEAPGRLPVRVTPAETLRGGSLRVPATSSSQFVSALLMIGPCLPEGLQLRLTEDVTSASYVELTINTLWRWDVLSTEDIASYTSRQTIRVSPAVIPGQRVRIEPDASSALYWFAAAALRRGSRVTIPDLDLDSPQPDAWFLSLLEDAGAEVTEREDTSGSRQTQLTGTGRLAAQRFDGSDCPDGVLAFTAIAAMADGRSQISGLGTLRVKESDRIAALAAELGRIGCAVEATSDSIAIDPAGRHDEPVVIETYNDHRMAMAFAVLGLARPGLSISNPACVSKSYPAFWRDLARLYD
ncbi:MAG: 3-phosphoshikimate 1-carboxyvinyltransferase, partial [Planctomycetota bacterium]